MLNKDCDINDSIGKKTRYTNDEIIDCYKRNSYSKLNTAKALKMTLIQFKEIINSQEGLYDELQDVGEEIGSKAFSKLNELIDSGHFNAVKYALDTHGVNFGFGTESKHGSYVKSQQEAITRLLGQGLDKSKLWSKDDKHTNN